MNWKQRRYLMTVPAIVFLLIAGSRIQQVTAGSTGVGVWIVLVSSLIAGGASVLAINQYANREAAQIRRAAGSDQK